MASARKGGLFQSDLKSDTPVSNQATNQTDSDELERLALLERIRFLQSTMEKQNSSIRSQMGQIANKLDQGSSSQPVRVGTPASGVRR